MHQQLSHGCRVWGTKLLFAKKHIKKAIKLKGHFLRSACSVLSTASAVMVIAELQVRSIHHAGQVC